MKKEQVLPVLFGLLVFVALLAGVDWMIFRLIDKLNSIDSELSKALVVGSLSLAGAAMTLVFGKLWEQRIRVNQEIREKKIPVYEEQLKVMFQVLFASQRGEKPLEGVELTRAFSDFTEKLMIWGSSDVIKAWQEFRSHNWGSDNGISGMRKFESFVMVLRKDIGSENKKLVTGDLLKLFITDYDKFAEQQEYK